MDSSPAGAPVLLGLGANLGRPLHQLARAVERLGSAITVDALSSVYRTEPVGYAHQPDFYNLVLRGRTALEPEALLAAAQAVERALGRTRAFRNAPRTIDVDLLDHGGRIFRAPHLVLPHPGIAERGFVLHPLAEVAPEWRHPVLGRTAQELLSAAPALERVERVGPLSPADATHEPPLL